MSRDVKMNLGERIEDYRMLEPLGKGGFAQVYKAMCLTTGVFVAIKKIDKRMMLERGLEKRVRQEVIIHSQLKHPSIVEMFAFFEDENYVYLVLELARHGNLQIFLNNLGRTMSETETAGVMKQVVAGLLYLHSLRIVHRDLSLSNLLLMDDRRVKIADFGLAVQLEAPDERHVTLCGTPNYMSPEVASRTSHGPPADVWSVGIMIYTLLVGRPPFATPATSMTLNRVVTSPCQLPSYLSPDAVDLLSRLLQKNPSERIALEDIPRHAFMLANSLLHVQSMDSGFATSSSSQNRSRRCFEATQSAPDFLSDLAVKRSLDVPPLNTRRLQATRHSTKNLVFHILPGGDVTVEFIRMRTLGECVTQVCRISGDGRRIVVYEPPGGVAPVREEPPGVPPHAEEYSHDDLPEVHWKKYRYAARFVDLVRQKTPKVTFYSTQAKCQLMESLVDCELTFYDGGMVTRSGEDVRVKASSGKTEEKWMLEHCEECFRHCLELERTLQSVTTGEGFPAIVGRRPTNTRDSPSVSRTPNLSSLSSFALSGGSQRHPQALRAIENWQNCAPKEDSGMFHGNLQVRKQLRQTENTDQTPLSSRPMRLFR
ncbi:serine/threonine-protein kinase PLK4 [Phlebotomus argentipes]|uniref:serine/threonine-protein kinase PLK4 n=1 Tax=Phlebotomus argentipes TaxID=94469 RepID=UPI002892B97E|nr:serine/threonine-protein kinase PLK4 [Phlebotomus argentipes]